MKRLIALIAVLLALPVQAETIVSGMSETNVSIGADFDGTSILIYGAAAREDKPPVWPLLHVVVTVKGPVQPIFVRKKERVAGIWINQGWVAYDGAPSFYAVMSTGPLGDILSAEADAAHDISIPRGIGAVRLGASSGSAADYLAALRRIRGAEGSYLQADTVLLLQQSLFRTEVTLPANLIEGDYEVRIFLARGGAVIDEQRGRITVRKAGLERFLTRLAQDQPLIYGLIALLLAAVAGGGASELFRRLRL